MTREQVAELFQISTRTVSELTARGVIIAVKLGGGRNAPVRYRRKTLEETAKKRERREGIKRGGVLSYPLAFVLKNFACFMSSS